MTPAERDRMNLLSMLIQCERNHQKYLEYVKEINGLMSQKEKRLAEAEGTHQDRQNEPGPVNLITDTQTLELV